MNVTTNLLRLLEQHVGGQMVRELAREARLAGADRALDDDVAALRDVHAYVYRR